VPQRLGLGGEHSTGEIQKRVPMDASHRSARERLGLALDQQYVRVAFEPAEYNESGFRMAWKKLRRLALVGSAAHSHRRGHQGLLNEMA
jgi:hypothetical protein